VSGSRGRYRRRSYSSDYDRSLSRSRERDRRRRRRDRSESRSPERSRKRASRSRERKRRKHKKKHKKKHKRSRSASVASVNSDEGLTPAQITQKRELEALTRDARTVFVSQLQVKVSEKDLKYFFKKFCEVKDVVLIRDRFTNKSKGFGYVEVKTLEDVPKALLVSGKKFIFRGGKEGFPVSVKASEAEKNFTHNMEKRALEASLTMAQKKADSFQTGPSTKSSEKREERDEDYEDRLEITRLHPNIGETEVNELCSAFGPVVVLRMSKDSYGDNVADVTFEMAADAAKALKELDGMDLAGARIRVRKKRKPRKILPSEKFGSLRDDPEDRRMYRREGNIDSHTWKLEDDDQSSGRQGGGGVAMNANTRRALMAKLAGGVGGDMVAEQQQRTAQAIAASVPKDTGPGRIQGAPSKFLLIKNMFNPAEETEADWADAVREDTEIECSKFGKVLHCSVDQQSQGGHVYLMFDSIQAGVDASHALHGRWFAKRMVQVEYLKRDVYIEKYPQVQQLQ